MTQQPLDLRKSLQIVWRHRVLVGVVAVLGLLAGIGWAVLNPPMLTSQALVVLAPSVHDPRTQVVIAGSDPVLTGALHSVRPGMSLGTLRSRIQIQSVAFNLISISGQGKTAVQAQGIANAVADSYVHYVGAGSLPGQALHAQVLQPATEVTTADPKRIHLVMAPGLGTLLGLLLGAIAALAISRSDRRLRERDEIAEAIGVPVLASIPAAHPSNAAGWKKLLEEYEPGAVDAWSLRKALQHLGLDSGAATGDSGGSSLMVLTLSHDKKALALGPQLAIFAASLGIPTAFVLRQQQDTNATATLRAACVSPPVPSRHLPNLWVAVSDQVGPERPPDAALAVVVSVVDSRSPEFDQMTRADVTVLGVSSGGATAEQLACVAAGAAADGRRVAGILMANPDPADHTTGRMPQLARLEQPNYWMRMDKGQSERA